MTNRQSLSRLRRDADGGLDGMKSSSNTPPALRNTRSLLGSSSACRSEPQTVGVCDEVNDEASSRAEKEAKKLLEGTEEEQMDRLPDENSELDWEERVARYPRANDKFQALWSKAKSDLNFDLMQARVFTRNLDRIERIETLIAIAQRRIDEVFRELDRHRVIRGQFNKFSVASDGTKAAPPKMITGKVINKKVA